MPGRLSASLATWALGLIVSYGIFVGIISIRMGVYHAQRDAFWVPILGGGLCILSFLWIFYRFARYVRHSLKRSERLRI